MPLTDTRPDDSSGARAGCNGGKRGIWAVVAVGTGLSARLPAQIRTCSITAYGSCLGCLAKDEPQDVLTERNAEESALAGMPHPWKAAAIPRSFCSYATSHTPSDPQVNGRIILADGRGAGWVRMGSVWVRRFRGRTAAAEPAKADAECPPAETEKCLFIHRTAVRSSERPTTVVVWSLSGRSRLNTVNVCPSPSMHSEQSAVTKALPFGRDGQAQQ